MMIAGVQITLNFVLGGHCSVSVTLDAVVLTENTYVLHRRPGTFFRSTSVGSLIKQITDASKL
jgi:hypothetical protein